MKVLAVLDGDTFDLSNGQRIRLAGIDAPELAQSFGDDAKTFLETHLPLNSTPTLKGQYLDKWDRVLAEVISEAGVLVNEEIVRQGLAWIHPFYGSNVDDADALALAQSEAIANNRGVHSDPDVLPPWHFRLNTGFQELANTVRTAAIAQGVKNYKELGSLCHLSQTTSYRLWTNCNAFPSRRTLSKLCGGLQVDINEILTLV